MKTAKMAFHLLYNLNQNSKSLERGEQADIYLYSFVYVCYLYIHL